MRPVRREADSRKGGGPKAGRGCQKGQRQDTEGILRTWLWPDMQGKGGEGVKEESSRPLGPPGGCWGCSLVYPSTIPPAHPSIRLSTHRSSPPPTHPFILPSTYLPTHPSTPIYPCTSPFTCQSTHPPPSTHVPIHPPIHPLIQPVTHPSSILCPSTFSRWPYSGCCEGGTVLSYRGGKKVGRNRGSQEGSWIKWDWTWVLGGQYPHEFWGGDPGVAPGCSLGLLCVGWVPSPQLSPLKLCQCHSTLGETHSPA